MCGIAGFYGFRNDKLIKEISDKLKHRGPNDEGFFINDKLSLLNRRLAIIDLSGGGQPIFNEDKSAVVVFNGEIYNYLSLKKDLEKKGHLFKTKSDTEVIIHGYEQWGEKYFDRLNGMFAIALWDQKKNKLVLARDHFGIKPLYFAYPVGWEKSRLVFSSEIKPIFESDLIEKKPNQKAIYRYLRYRIHDDGRETFFKDIFRLLPGEVLTVQGSLATDSEEVEFKLQNYTNLKEKLLKIKPTNKFNQKAVNVFKDKLIEAVRLRLVSEVPVGSCLSGGLDSSTVVVMVNKLLKEKIKEAESVGKKQKVFSAVFPSATNDEEKYIDEVLKFQPKGGRPLSEKLESHKIEPQPEEFFKEIEKFIKVQEEPTISTGPYAQFKVMREVKKYITVLLDGQGADEMMAGYVPYYFVYFRQLLKQKKYLVLFKELFNSSDILLKTAVNRLIGVKNVISEKDLLNNDFTNKFKNETFSVVKNNLKKRLVDDIFSDSLQSLLRYEDRNSMHYSIEGRVPFLDFNLLKYLFSLPDKAIISAGWNKNILRQATKDLLPDSINKRRNKIGFTTPEHQWFMRMKNKIYQLFLSESFAKRIYFNQKEVLKAFQRFIEGKFEDTMIFWRLLNLELWLKIFFDPPSTKAIVNKERKFGEPNEEKKIEITVDNQKYFRYPIKTSLFKKGDNFVKKIVNELAYFIKTSQREKIKNKNFFLVVSEKIIAVSQGRSFFLWEIKPSFFAKLLSKFVTKNPFGIGLGSPWTMELAIKEAGLMRILLATAVSALTKTFGIKGVFYRIAGHSVAAIDGPTEYSLYPSNVSAKLGPKEPQEVAKDIHNGIKQKLLSITDFQGVVIIDSNDIGQNVLGNSTNIPDKIVEEIFKDNPMGQADEQTPIVIVFCI